VLLDAVATGKAITVTTVGVLVAEQVPLDTVTVKVPLVVTVIDCVVAAVDHK
jgi:antitoxin (DNA-binding transcriptional repressor) of toxin-antitoxin stability system